MGPIRGPKALSEMTSTAINPVYQSVTDSYVKIIASDRKRKATPAAKEKGNSISVHRGFAYDPLRIGRNLVGR